MSIGSLLNMCDITLCLSQCHIFPKIVMSACWLMQGTGLDGVVVWSGQSVFLRELTSLHPPHGLCKSGILTAMLVHKCIKITAPVVCGWSLWNSQYFLGHTLSLPSCCICWWSVNQWSVLKSSDVTLLFLLVSQGVRRDKALLASG